MKAKDKKAKIAWRKKRFTLVLLFEIFGY